MGYISKMILENALPSAGAVYGGGVGTSLGGGLLTGEPSQNKTGKRGDVLVRTSEQE